MIKDLQEIASKLNPSLEFRVSHFYDDNISVEVRSPGDALWATAVEGTYDYVRGWVEGRLFEKSKV